jgi:hypothetical protein
MKIELDNDEARVLLEMINVAVKASGLDGAEAGLHFRKKIQEAAKAEGEQEQPSQDAQ